METEVSVIPKLRRVFSLTMAQLNALVDLLEGDLGYAEDLTQLFRQDGDGAANWVAITSGLIGQGARAFHTVGMTIPNNTPTYIVFDGTEWDTDNMWLVGEPTQLMIATAGIYVCSAGIYWDFKGDLTERNVIISVNRSYHIGSSIEPNNNDVTRHFAQSVTGIGMLAIGDYVELLVQHSSGANLEVLYASAWSPSLTVQRISN